MAEEQKIEETLSRRGGTYGDFRDNARISQNIKKAMQDSPNWQVLPPYLKEGLELIALKMSRILSGDPLYADNPHDMIGYAKLIEDRAAQDREAGVVIPSPGDPLYPEYIHTFRTELGTAKGITGNGPGATPAAQVLGIRHHPQCAVHSKMPCDIDCAKHEPAPDWKYKPTDETKTHLG